jgi:phosphohistidine phosphatase
MPTLILMRHAKAARRPGLDDHARPLTERGREDAALVAHALRDAHLAPDLILASD